jgi:fructose-bisphosphate aldolase class II
MLVPLSQLLSDAKRGRYGIPALAVENELNCRAAIEAGEKARSPLIFLSGYNDMEDMDYFIQTIHYYSDKTSVPVSIIRDHTLTFADAIKGIKNRFPAIMVDRSTLPYQENAEQVRELVRIAHSCGVEVEGELGHVGQGGEYDPTSKSSLTVPEEAKKFVEETGVDFLAVAIGSAHGIYKGTPKLHFDLLDQLNEAVPVPLVLHGATGTGDENITTACQRGICKVNIGTDLYIGVRDAIKSADLKDNKVYRFYQEMQKGYINKAMYWMDICGSANRA